MKPFRSLGLLLLTLVFARAADYVLPTQLQPAANTWQLAGVPGGINAASASLTVVTWLTPTGDSTDRTDDINNGLAALTAGQALGLRAGTYVCLNELHPPNPVASATLRGLIGEKDSSGNPASIIDSHVPAGNSSVLRAGIGATYEQSQGAGIAITVADLTKGATTFHVTGDASFLAVGQLVVLEMENDYSYPYVHDYGNYFVRQQYSKITALGTGTVTIQAPGCYDSFTYAPSARLYTAQFGGTRFGVENIWLDGRNGSATNGLDFETCWGSWARNVRVTGAINHAIYCQAGSLNCEFNHCWIDANTFIGTNHGGIILDFVCGSKIENCYLGPYQPQMEINFGSAGNVIAYNFLDSTNPPTGGAFGINLNHGPHTYMNLVEGNIGTNIQSDGNFGSSSRNVIARNWWYGASILQGTGAITNALKRFTREWTYIGNVFGRTGIGGGDYTADGLPNIGNAAFTNTVQPSLGIWWPEMNAVGTTMIGQLTTRTDNLHGVVTLTTGTLDPADRASGADTTIVLSHPSDGSVGPRIAFTSVTGGGTIIAVDGTFFPGWRETLPALNSTFEVWPSASGFQAKDLDVRASSNRWMDYMGQVSGSGIPSVEQFTAGTTVPTSYYLASQPSWWNDYGTIPFPAIDSTAPIENTYNQIPAALWFQSTQNVVANPIFSPVAGLYTTTQSVTISCSTSGATIHYTTDGTTPTSSSATYSTAISVPTTTTVKALAVKATMTDSGVSSATYTITTQSSAPSFSPPAGSYGSPQSITITTSTSGASLYYTTDGSTPTTSSTLYSTAVSIPTTATLKALAHKSGLVDSTVTSGTYTIGGGSNNITLTGNVSVGSLHFP